LHCHSAKLAQPLRSATSDITHTLFMTIAADILIEASTEHAAPS